MAFESQLHDLLARDFGIFLNLSKLELIPSSIKVIQSHYLYRRIAGRNAIMCAMWLAHAGVLEIALACLRAECCTSAFKIYLLNVHTHINVGIHAMYIPIAMGLY